MRVDEKPDPPEPEGSIDWSLTTWEGSRREQLRRWAELPLDRAILAVEEMQALAADLNPRASCCLDRPGALLDQVDLPLQH